MIDKESLAQIILDFQEKKLPDLIERELKVPLEIPLKRAITILGPRRCGKTYYLYLLIKKLLEKKIPKQRILYVNFEEPKFVNADFKDLELLLEVFFEIFPQNKKKKVWLFFDEIQNINNWEIFIRKLLDKENVCVFLSGSSSKLLSKEIATSMRGRTINYLLLPFSFSEFLKAKKIKFERYLSSEKRAVFFNALKEYLDFGGYPEAVIYPKERKKIIQEIIEVTIWRDLIERHKIRNEKVVKLMFNYLISAKKFSIHKFYNFLKSLSIKVSKNTLYNFLEYFNDAFVFFPLRKFSFSLKKIEQSIAKIYCVDNGLIEKNSQQEAKKLENLVFLTFLRQGLELNKDVFYFTSNNKEVDFLLKKEEKIKLFQVCVNLKDYQTKEREIKSLLKAAEELKAQDLFIITLDEEEKQEKIKDKSIKILPLWKFLMMPNY